MRMRNAFILHGQYIMPSDEKPSLNVE